MDEIIDKNKITEQKKKGEQDLFIGVLIFFIYVILTYSHSDLRNWLGIIMACYILGIGLDSYLNYRITKAKYDDLLEAERLYGNKQISDK